MPFDIKETTLPGAGKKYELYLDENRSIATLIETGGKRIVYYREDSDADYDEVFDLSDDQARTLGLFLVGAYYQPIAAEIPEETKSGEHIEWYSITDESPLKNVALGDVDIESETGATLLGVEHGSEVISAPDSEFVLEEGDRLIVVGTSEAHKRMNALLGE